MHRAVWKFPIEATYYQTVTMPRGAGLLHVDTQHGGVCVWALVDPEAETTERMLYVVGTGGEVPEERNNPAGPEHVGSWLMHDGTLGFHLFDGGEQ